MINVEDWAEIRRLHRADGMCIKAIARRLGVARNTVRTALRSDQPPRYEREGKGLLVDAVEPRMLELLREFPDMPATVIAERVGWRHSMTVLRDRVAELRPLFVPPDPCQRTTYRPGELAQFDLWQRTADASLRSARPGGRRGSTPASCSRVRTARLCTRRRCAGNCAGWRRRQGCRGSGFTTFDTPPPPMPYERCAGEGRLRDARPRLHGDHRGRLCPRLAAHASQRRRRDGCRARQSR